MKLPILRTLSQQRQHIRTPSLLLQVPGAHLQARRGIKLVWLLGPEPKRWSKDFYKRYGFYAFVFYGGCMAWLVHEGLWQFSGRLVPREYRMLDFVDEEDYLFRLHRFSYEELEIAKVQRQRKIEMFLGIGTTEVEPEKKDS